MIDEIKTCVDLKLNVFKEYFIVPDEFQCEMDDLVRAMEALGEECNDAVEFEERFASEGLMESYNALFPKCLPKKHKMTKAERRKSLEVGIDMLNKSKKEILNDGVKKFKENIRNDFKDDLIEKNRERMIEDGTFDDYTIATNKVDDIGRLAGFLRKKFKKE